MHDNECTQVQQVLDLIRFFRTGPQLSKSPPLLAREDLIRLIRFIRSPGEKKRLLVTGWAETTLNLTRTNKYRASCLGHTVESKRTFW